jgi:hypothetical protein
MPIVQHFLCIHSTSSQTLLAIYLGAIFVLIFRPNASHISYCSHHNPPHHTHNLPHSKRSICYHVNENYDSIHSPFSSSSCSLSCCFRLPERWCSFVYCYRTFSCLIVGINGVVFENSVGNSAISPYLILKSLRNAFWPPLKSIYSSYSHLQPT